MTNTYKALNELIFDGFGQDKNYHKIRHKLLNAHETMFEKHESFRLLPLEKQLDYCVTICAIVTDTVRQSVNEVKPLSKPNDTKYEYSIDRNWQELTPIKI